MATLEWLLVSVCSLIYYKTRNPWECLITKAALKRFLPSMSSLASRNHDRLEYKMASPQCVFSCCSSVRMSQWLLWAGVSPVWVLLCASYALKEDKVHEKVLSQRMQWSGFSQYKFRCWFTLGENFTTTETLWWSLSSMCIPVVRYSSVKTRWWPSISNRLHHWDRSEQTSYCIHGV